MQLQLLSLSVRDTLPSPVDSEMDRWCSTAGRLFYTGAVL